MTHQYIFDYKPKDIYWCTADIGWVTGHSYIIYGPLSNGATTIMFEGVPNYPDSSRWWRIVDKYKINVFYTAPTAIRALMREGDSQVKKLARKSLKLLGTVGEPINPEAWMWYFNIVGEWKMPNSRYMVANRNWWNFNFSSTWCYRPQTRLCHKTSTRRKPVIVDSEVKYFRR